MDDQLERLMDEWQQSVEEASRHCRQPTQFKILCDLRDKRRSALRSYLSEDTRRLDWLAKNCLEASAADTYLRLEYESGLPLRDAIDKERPA